MVRDRRAGLPPRRGPGRHRRTGTPDAQHHVESDDDRARQGIDHRLPALLGRRQCHGAAGKPPRPQQVEAGAGVVRRPAHSGSVGQGPVRGHHRAPLLPGRARAFRSRRRGPGRRRDRPLVRQPLRPASPARLEGAETGPRRPRGSRDETWGPLPPAGAAELVLVRQRRLSGFARSCDRRVPTGRVPPVQGPPGVDQHAERHRSDPRLERDGPLRARTGGA